ncbi:hypothetical protein [Acidimangrovimonas sediminis]|uniref:hypothetical protein n=1 Tax=Acidimangrovimonas sediminis TaxID=2056283 RepID=UPI000C7F9F69|nr:hypothetical protein [Acidimangrovimonas sediminis]
MKTFALTSKRVAIGSAAALTLALGTAAVTTPAHAQGGDITRGVILGAIGGVALDQLANQPSRRDYYAAPPPRTDYVYERPAHRRVVREYVYHSHAASPAQQAFDSQPHRMRVSIQYQLMQRGLYNSGLDGAWGPGTSDALYSYARNHHKEGMLATVNGSDQLFSDLLG